MKITLLFSRLKSVSLETGYGLEQSRRLLEHQADFAALIDFGAADSAKDTVASVETDLVLVLTDPLAIVSPNMIGTLVRALESHEDTAAAVPTTNITTNAAQRRDVPPSFLTLGQFERRFHDLETTSTVVDWTDADPGLYLVRTSVLRDEVAPLVRALERRRVVIAEDAFLFRYAPQRRMPRLDLLELVPSDAESILEIGCGEGVLGEQLRNRKGARVVGIEIDEDAASAASERLEKVYTGDAREVIRKIDERFEWIVGGDVLEHLTDPWEFLRELKRVAKPGGKLLLSIPNMAAWPVVAELLRGRFDYLYAGHLSAGHLRFFTKKTIEDTISMGSWSIEWIRPQPEIAPHEKEELFAKLDRGGISYSREDLSVPGWYVLARN